MAWTITYYVSGDNDNPIYDFIESLSISAKGKVYRSLNLLEEYNIKLREPHVKKLTGTNLWELRIIGSDNIRIFYIAHIQSSFLLLHGFVKKTQKTSKKEINTAEKRLHEYTTRNKIT